MSQKAGKGNRVTAQRVLLTILVWLWCGCAMAQGVAFGPIEVASAMGEPLHVKIPLKSPPKSPLENLEALWGVPTNYSHAGGPALTIFAQQSESGDALLIDSDRGMTIPFFTLLVKFVLDGQIHIQNFPVFLGDQGAGSTEPGLEGHPPPLPSNVDGQVMATPEPYSLLKTLKNNAFWLIAMILSGLSAYLWRLKQQSTNKGLLPRGFSRNRPMATPIAGRETAGFEPMSKPGTSTETSRNGPMFPPPSAMQVTTTPEVSTKTVAKGVKINSVTRKKVTPT